MFMKNVVVLILFFILTGCVNTMKPIDFIDKTPRLIIEDYLSGNVKAWGVLQNRSGKVTRQFKADLNGKWDGSQLILDEVFNWTDGEKQTRQWTMKKLMHIITKQQLPMLWAQQKAFHMGQLLR